MTLRESEQELDVSASSLDKNTDLTARETLQIFARTTYFFKFFKARIAAKLGFITLEHTFRLLIIPWPLKIIVDHVILGQPIPANGSGFPSYLGFVMPYLSTLGVAELMLWMLTLGVLMVVLFGMTPNRATGRHANGAYTGAAAGSLGNATAVLADGHDTATRTENAANSAASEMGGIFGILDFKVHLRLSQSLNHLLRTQLAQHIKALPLETLDDQRIGDNVYRVLYDSTSATGIYEAMTMGIYSGILMVALTLYIMFTSFGNAPEVIVVGILVGPVTFLFVVPFARMTRRRSQASRASGSNTTSNIEEGMSNVLAVQSLGGNKREGERFSQASAESFKRFRSETLIKLITGRFGSLAFLTGQIIFFIVMAGYVIDGTYTAGDYFVVFYYFFVLSAVFYSFGFLYTELQSFIAGLRRVFFLLDLPTENMDTGLELPKIRNGIRLSNVDLTYPDGRQALKKINLSAKVGEIIALVGPTGAGKTSLAYLIPRFLRPSSGEIFADDYDLSKVKVESLRNQTSYVFQETQLFSESIAHNIRYGNNKATDQEIERAAQIAGAHDFISKLPDGYETNLGTITSKLSVGQKQRIAIARGLLRQSQILILDEPTSALDPETESYLIDALHEAAKDKLVIIIAHRLSTIVHSDRIYFLEDGEIKESGSHSELMNLAEGQYKNYVAMQTSSD